jgi:hypothetical protein
MIKIKEKASDHHALPAKIVFDLQQSRKLLK